MKRCSGFSGPLASIRDKIFPRQGHSLNRSPSIRKNNADPLPGAASRKKGHEGIEKREFRNDIDADAIAVSLLGAFDALLLQTWFDDAIEPKTAAQKMLDSLFYGTRK